MNKILRKADLLLFFFFLAAAVLIAAVPLVQSSAEGRQVRITCRGSEYGTYPLDQDAEIEISSNGHTNIVVIESRAVRMEYSDCHNQICVDTGSISRSGETIVCLPNRVVVEITGSIEGGEEDDTIDAVVQ